VENSSYQADGQLELSSILETRRLKTWTFLSFPAFGDGSRSSLLSYGRMITKIIFLLNKFTKNLLKALKKVLRASFGQKKIRI